MSTRPAASTNSRTPVRQPTLGQPAANNRTAPSPLAPNNKTAPGPTANAAATRKLAAYKRLPFVKKDVAPPPRILNKDTEKPTRPIDFFAAARR